MTEEKRVPMRTCIVCRNKSEKNDLVRISCDKNKNVKIDFDGTHPGRGAYVCGEECLKKAIKTGALNRAFKCSVPQDVYRYLEEEIAKGRL